jgi:hypothetical protein
MVLTAQQLHAPAAEDTDTDADVAPAWVKAVDVAAGTVSADDFALFVRGVAQAGLRSHQLLKTAPGPLMPVSDAFLDVLLRQASFGPARRASTSDLWTPATDPFASAPVSVPVPVSASAAAVPASVDRAAAEAWLARAFMFGKLVDAVALYTFLQRDELLHDDFEVRTRASLGKGEGGLEGGN